MFHAFIRSFLSGDPDSQAEFSPSFTLKEFSLIRLINAIGGNAVSRSRFATRSFPTILAVYLLRADDIWEGENGLRGRLSSSLGRRDGISVANSYQLVLLVRTVGLYAKHE